MGQLNFSLGQFRVNRFLVQYVCREKISNFVENFGSGMVRFGSIQVSDPLQGKFLSDVGSGIGLVRLVRDSGQFF